ncbi:GNAT family N-acetyltransferase [Amycolatopsis nigrescens]|uniref:GNAT family N-acetyltransferase n=1 Tax=Amycolatopsis nigrescens TaxID=381445 RepID=UPI0003725638|nr:GNAT family N-acetyltransferase [Amycolatopsis nigrescens]
MTEPTPALPWLIRTWQAGWGVARGLAPAEEARGALHVLHGRPWRQLELIALHADDDPESLRRLALEVAGATEPNWLTVPTNRTGDARPILAGAGLELFEDTEWFMSTDLRAHPVHHPPEPYTSRTTVDGPIIETELWHPSGTRAARGTMVMTGPGNTAAVAHDIETAPGHRRRGLASALMSMLAREAVAQGSVTGLLVASPEGQRLYSALGWQERATVLVSRTRDESST